MLTKFSTVSLLAITLLLNSEPQSVDLRFLQPMDTAGKIHRLIDNGDRKGTVFVFLSPTCPTCVQTTEELNRLASEPAGKSITVFGVLSDPAVTRSKAVEFAMEAKVTFPVLFDAAGELATLLKPTRTPEAFLLNAKGEIVYQGRVDNRLATTENSGPAQRDLFVAMSALANGEAIATPRTEAIGCNFEAADPKSTKVTYARHIAPLVYANCAECHRPGQVAPFSLLTYDDASKRAEFLSDVTKSRLMPPWKATIDYGHFADERQLTDSQIAMIQAWHASGAPKGDDADMPPVPKFPEGWRLGEPDVVIEAPVPYTVPADGPDIFQHFVIPVEIPEEKTLIGFEYRPSNPAVAHHAVIFLDATGGARAKDAETPEPGFRTSGSVEGSVTAMVGVWTPGMTPRYYPEGIGIRMPKTIDVVLQMHLHPTGKVESEQSKIALYFSDQPADQIQRQQMLLLGSLAIDIPPGSDRHAIGSSLTLPIDMTLLSVFPHLHLIGKEMKVTATLPDGKAMPLIWIKDWNFFWQDSYHYKDPVLLPKGTTIRVEAAYDNSADNPFNPSTPPQRVLFGNGSTDEMCFAFFQFVSDEKQGMVRLGPALMQSMLSEWRKANIDDEARDKIIDEAGKLFGRRSKDMLKSVLALSGKSAPKAPAPAETPATTTESKTP